MDKIKITGGVQLEGAIVASGSKNSCLPLLFSSLLASGHHTFHNVPQVKDIETAGKLLQSLGCQVEFSKNSVRVHVPESIQNVTAHYDLMKTMRAGILCLGPLLARVGKAQVSLPGGCAIGGRPVNWHIESLKKLGAQLDLKSGYIYAKRDQPLKGTEIFFEKPSVGGTQNVMMAGALAQGRTRIHQAAQEPEIVDLAQYMIKMGARIQGAGTSLIDITGVSHLKPAQHTVISDRIEVATLLIAVACTRGKVKIEKCHPHHLEEVILKLRETGCDIKTGDGWIQLISPKSFSPVTIETAPYPGFPTDVQAQMMALMTQAEGMSSIKECIFENRFMHVPELNRMNAQISVQKRTASIQGPRSLQSASVTATDLRASSSLIIAGLSATGETTVHRVYHLDRGYEKLEEKLALLGAQIQRVR